jgi:hypothetical protein
MERNDVTEVYNEVKGLFDGFARMWRRWDIDAQSIAGGVWLIKHGGNALRPFRISVIPPTEDALPWVSLDSNEKTGSFQATKKNWRYIRSYFERLTEYLVIGAAHAPAVEKSKLYIRKSGKHLYLQLPVEDGNFSFSFNLRRRGWTWAIWRWRSGLGWVEEDRIYCPLNENPIEMFIAVVSNIRLKLL